MSVISINDCALFRIVRVMIENMEQIVLEDSDVSNYIED